MSETANIEGASNETDKPVPESTDVKFPPFPEPTDADFEDDVPEDERNYYKNKFPDINNVKYMRLHCTACDRHLGSSARNISRMRSHPMLRTLVCHTCHTFYNSGEFEKGDDGSELYCRWCGQGGQVYCCSNCPHVFCAKCIKRNLGVSKIKEIESTDDWKCFKCVPGELSDLRAICWALLRYCDLKNEITYKTEDQQLKEAFQKECSQDYTECCRNIKRRRERQDQKKKEEKIKIETDKTPTTVIIPKIPSTIQVKKFASINLEESQKNEKKATKRPASPKSKLFIKNPMSTGATPRILTPVIFPPAKKIRMANNVVNPVSVFPMDNKFTPSFTRIQPKPITSASLVTNFNGFNNARVFNNAASMVVNDNINLSLESLTQGLDMATVAAMSTNNNSQNDDVVCTPDFPMEPLCEVTEDNDDDVQCITPDAINLPKNNTLPPLVPRSKAKTYLTSDNIVQMTENDVSVNQVTGGLKFRVDPQTLSSNKMYRLPDGRVFAINANPNMPGGYSATIVAVTETPGKVIAPPGATYAAKLSAIPNPNLCTPKNKKPQINASSVTRRSTPIRNSSQRQTRECDLNVPVEWYRYNLVDAIDTLEFSLSRLQKLKKETSTVHLRMRTVGEMKNLHRTLDRILNNSTKRVQEIRECLNKEMKKYATRKSGGTISDDEDDDVEILPSLENEDPIFIDENSVESTEQEIDLTGMNNSEHNDSGEKETTIPSIDINSSHKDEDDNNAESAKVTADESNLITEKDVGKSDEDNQKKDEIKTVAGDNEKHDENNKIIDSNKEMNSDNCGNNENATNTTEKEIEPVNNEKTVHNDNTIDDSEKIQESDITDAEINNLLRYDIDPEITTNVNELKHSNSIKVEET